jgi:nitric oxide reductase activation protein
MKTDLKPLTILVGRQRNTLRRVETIGKALIRLEGKKVYWEVFNRHRRYLASLANLTLAIEAVRREEGKEVKVLGRLAT